MGIGTVIRDARRLQAQYVPPPAPDHVPLEEVVESARVLLSGEPEGSEHFFAAVVLLAGTQVGYSLNALVAYTGYERDLVVRFLQNLLKNGVIKGHRHLIDAGWYWDVPDGELTHEKATEVCLAFALDVLTATGEVVRYTPSFAEAEPEKAAAIASIVGSLLTKKKDEQHELHLATYAEQRMAEIKANPPYTGKRRGRPPKVRVEELVMDDGPDEPIPVGTVFKTEDPNLLTARAEDNLRRKLRSKRRDEEMAERVRIRIAMDSEPKYLTKNAAKAEEERFARVAGHHYVPPEKRIENMMIGGYGSGHDQEDSVRRIYRSVKHSKAQ